MTDQQAPERFNPDYELVDVMDRHPSGTYVRYEDYEAKANLLEAAEKRIKELEGIIRAKDYDYNRAIDERDQALASVGAVIEKAATKGLDIDIEIDLSNGRSAYIDTIKAVRRNIRRLNPDATAALNEMLADAWDEGHHAGEYTSRKTLNPYRKDSS